MPQSFFKKQMAMYQSYHQDRRNRFTHFIGIPLLLISVTLAIAVMGGPVTMIIFTSMLWALWMSLEMRIGLAMGAFVFPAAILVSWLARFNSQTAWWICAALFILGWIFQLIGHGFEGKRPAFLSNLFQLIIGPMFLMAEIFEILPSRKTKR
jgi:uncharacterized membrane protein YGL010W